MRIIKILKYFRMVDATKHNIWPIVWPAAYTFGGFSKRFIKFSRILRSLVQNAKSGGLHGRPLREHFVYCLHCSKVGSVWKLLDFHVIETSRGSIPTIEEN